MQLQTIHKAHCKDALGKALIKNDMIKAPFQLPASDEGQMRGMDWDYYLFIKCFKVP